MKKSILTAAVASVGLMIGTVIIFAMVLSARNPNVQFTGIGPSSGVWDRFLFAPLFYIVGGLVFGAIAAPRNNLRDTLRPAATTSLVLAIAQVWATRQMLLLAQPILLEKGIHLSVGALTPSEIGISIAAGALWVAWYCAGAALAHKMRTRARGPKTVAVK